MERDPESYRNFIRQYQDRILFGSDALVSQPEQIQSALTFIERFLDNVEIFSKLVHENYLAFHDIPMGRP